MNELIYNMEMVIEEQTQPETQAPEVKKEVKLIDVEIVNENVALNVMVSFLNLAQRRGVFSIDEAAKIWECVKKFQKTA
jgi:hypothetical protein